MIGKRLYNRTPIIDALKAYDYDNFIKFHTGSRGKSPIEFWKWDFTEAPTLDNLQCPTGVILEAERLAASTFGADHTFFSVNGSTASILALILGTCNDGDILIVDRNCHISVFNAMIFAGVKPVFINPTYENQIAIHTDTDSFSKAAEEYGAVGVLITRPNYYGVAVDISNLSEKLHKSNKFLFVDEAHGAHFGFHERLPASALSCGADSVAQSAHKTLGALNQAAFLHLKGALISKDRLFSALSSVQTTSPSYPILASLDYSRAWLESEGKERYEKLMLAIDVFWDSLKEPFYKMETTLPQDPTRLVIGAKGFDLRQIEEELRLRGKIQVEMVDENYIVCIAIPGDEEGLKVFSQALNDCKPSTVSQATSFKPPDIPITGVIDIKSAKNAAHVDVKLTDAVGKISGELVTTFPPGIPILFPGETISPHIVSHICDIINGHSVIKGLTQDMKLIVLDDGGTNG